MLTNEQIDHIIPNTGRPQPWYDLVNNLLSLGFMFQPATADWWHPLTKKRGRIAFSEQRAWFEPFTPDPPPPKDHEKKWPSHKERQLTKKLRRKARRIESTKGKKQ